MLRAKGGDQEIQFAEFETRIRKFILELVEPTIRRTTILEEKMQDVETESQRHSSMLSVMGQKSVKVEQQIAVVEQFREEMSTWDAERRRAEAKVAENISTMKQELDAFRYSLERKDASMHGMQRTMDRAVSELGKSQEGNEALRQYVEKRLSEHGRDISNAKTDLEVKLISLETKHNRLCDELWSEETGLAQVAGKLATTNSLVTRLSEDIKRMQHCKANVVQLESVQEEVNELIRDANSNVCELKQTVGTVVSDVKEHFRTATNTIAAHNSSMLSELRSSYQEELGHSAKLRSEIVTFMQETQRNISHLEDVVGRAQDQTEQMTKKLQIDIEDLNKLRRRDKGNAELDTKSLREQLGSVGESSESVTKSVEHLGSILFMMLQSARAASALDLQDDTDRNNVALMGYRSTSSSTNSGPPSSRGSSRGSSRRSPEAVTDHGAPAGGGGGGAPVVSLDNRCLSCSGQGQTVLSGFKIACLQYAPGPVTYGKKNFVRCDLLDLRQRLLEQAHDALHGGPISFDKRELQLPKAIEGEGDSGMFRPSFRGNGQDSMDGGTPRKTSGGGQGSKMPPLGGGRPALPHR